MANYWAIAIGINQYQRLQPLMYAQWDAHAMQRFLVQEAQFSLDHCYLLTDSSATINGHSTLPVRENIQHFIVQLCQHDIEADDILWVFWSGYAVQHQGRDYLLPADGDPSQPVATGIPMSELIATLRTAPTQHIVLLLDMKQGGSALEPSEAEAQLGTHTLALAEKHQLALFLACQPGQFSHETLALRQGLFTTAVLEGMHSHGCVTLSHFGQYLSDRLPELSQQHWRPTQVPAVMIPAELRYQLILPGKTPQKPDPVLSSDIPGLDPKQPQPSAPPELEPRPVEAPHASQIPAPTPVPTLPSDGAASDGAASDGAASDISTDLSASDDDRFWAKLLKWGGLLFGLLLIGVLIRNWPALRGRDDPNDPNANAEEIEIVPAPNASTDGTMTAIPGDLVFDSADSAGGGSALDMAAQALETGQAETALQWLEEVPPDDQTDLYTTLKEKAEQLNSQVGQTNRAILDEAIASMNRARETTPVNQASDFHRAISQATRIQPGQPLYDDAQQAIQRWSRIILDLAEARAKTGNYTDAIASAQLVPPSQAELHQMAEQRISQWQEQIEQEAANADAIAEAEALIQPNEASSYSEAIAQLRSLQPGQPGYNQARVQIDTWGGDILDIAYDKAADDDLYEAINTAALVPEDSSAYLEAREAIAGWRQQLRGM